MATNNSWNSPALTTNGQLLIGGTSGVVSTTITQGSNMVVTNGDGSISLALSATPSITNITLGSGTPMGYYIEQQPWTPTISGSSVAGVGTYVSQSGYYTRIGGMIFLQAEIQWSAHTGSGDLLITSLPFISRNSANYSPEGIVNTQNINLPGGSSRTALGSMQPGTSTINVYVTTLTTNSNVALSSSGIVHLTITYLT